MPKSIFIRTGAHGFIYNDSAFFSVFYKQGYGCFGSQLGMPDQLTTSPQAICF